MKRTSQKGMTLIELTVASAIMSILFYAGLQMLSTLFGVHAALMNNHASDSVSMLKLETVLRKQIQAASDINIRDQGKTLEWEGSQKLLFRQDNAKHQWQLLSQNGLQKPHSLSNWPESTQNQRFEFVWNPQTNGLLSVYLGASRPALNIWLRNQP